MTKRENIAWSHVGPKGPESLLWSLQSLFLSWGWSQRESVPLFLQINRTSRDWLCTLTTRHACAHCSLTHEGLKKRGKKTQLICNLHTIVHAHTHALSELTHRSHDEESQLHYSKSPEMPQFKKKGEKRFADWQREETASVGEWRAWVSSLRVGGSRETQRRLRGFGYHWSPDKEF